MKKVAVVILNWNGVKMLEDYLPSVVNSMPEYAEVILADNASTDNSVAFVKEQYPNLKIIINKTNGGFAKGYNDALKDLEHEYLVLLNSDIETPNNWVQPVIEFMESNPDIGAAMPKILQLTKKTHFEYAGAAGGFIDKWGFPFCRGRIFEALEEDNGQYNDNKEIFWATGACMFVRNDLYKKLGGLDEFFFAHMEEIDLCWRVKRAGYKVYAIGNSHVYHLGGGTLKKVNPKKTFLNFRNNLLMLIKNHPSKGFTLKISQKLILDGIAGVKFLLEGKPNHTIAIIKAHFSVYANYNKFLKVRKSLKVKFGDKEVSKVYPRLIIWDYFKKGKKKFSDLNIK
jgi:GT2 family glycosyltransferase